MRPRSPFFKRFARRAFDAKRTGIMGIINATPDSFSDGGAYLDPKAAVELALRHVAEGAEILDIGAESTRPGATPVDPATELARLLPVLDAVHAKLPNVPISVDTRHAAVAREALAHGASIVNDVSGLADPDMAAVVRDADAGVVLMRGWAEHIGERKKPKFNLKRNHDTRPVTDWVVKQVCEVRERALAAGIPENNICLDVGIGFGLEDAENSAALIWATYDLQKKFPKTALLVGISRKRFLDEVGGDPSKEPTTEDLDQLTGLYHALLALKVHHIARVHNCAVIERGRKDFASMRRE